MKKLVLFLSFVFSAFFVGIFFSNFSALSKLEKQNLQILEAQEDEEIGMICYGGCIGATPSEICHECTSSNCHRIVMQSDNLGYRDQCSSLFI